MVEADEMVDSAGIGRVLINGAGARIDHDRLCDAVTGSHERHEEAAPVAGHMVSKLTKVAGGWLKY
jgi:hypothetical protein